MIAINENASVRPQRNLYSDEVEDCSSKIITDFDKYEVEFKFNIENENEELLLNGIRYVFKVVK